MIVDNSGSLEQTRKQVQKTLGKIEKNSNLRRTAMTIRFLRNKVVEVEPQTDGSLVVAWRLTDDLLKASAYLDGATTGS